MYLETFLGTNNRAVEDNLGFLQVNIQLVLGTDAFTYVEVHVC